MKRIALFLLFLLAACDGRALRRWIELAERYVGKLPTKGRK